MEKDKLLAYNEEKQLRHIDKDTFIKNPVSVYRTAQLAARFNVNVAKDTLILCKLIDTSDLSAEQVFAETNKVLLEAPKPSIYFSLLRDMNQLDSFFPILKNMMAVEQDPRWHPEGNVWNHTMEVIDKAVPYRNRAAYPLGFMYAALFHDIGKVFATTVDSDGSIHAYQHEIIGANHLKETLSKLTNHHELESYLDNMIRQHMNPHALSKRASMKSLNRFFDKCIAPYDSIMLSIADTVNEQELLKFESGWWDEKYQTYIKIKAKPEVTASDLINLGYEASPLFEDILNKCHDIHLAGINKEDILRQIPSIVKGIHSRKKKSSSCDNF